MEGSNAHVTYSEVVSGEWLLIVETWQAAVARDGCRRSI